jgi:periplasmic protein TonB
MRIDPLLANYPIRIREITVYVMFGLAAIFYFFPRFLGEAQKYDSSVQEQIVETIDIPQTQQFDIPEPPSRPTVPVASDEDFEDEDLTIDELDFDEIEELEAPPPESSNGPGFVFIPHEKDPIPKGGYRALMRNVVYPDIAREAGIEGTVYVDAFINKNGLVTESVIFMGIPNTGLNESALSAVRRTKWKPAKQRDKDIGVWMRIPIKFVLSSD